MITPLNASSPLRDNVTLSVVGCLFESRPAFLSSATCSQHVIESYYPLLNIDISKTNFTMVELSSPPYCSQKAKERYQPHHSRLSKSPTAEISRSYLFLAPTVLRHTVPSSNDCFNVHLHACNTECSSSILHVVLRDVIMVLDGEGMSGIQQYCACFPEHKLDILLLDSKFHADDGKSRKKSLSSCVGCLLLLAVHPPVPVV